MGMIGNAPAQGLFDSGNIKDGGVATIDIADSAVTTAKVADGAVTAAKLASSAVTDKLGYTPLNKAGDTLTGKLTLKANQYNNPDSASGIDAQNSDIVNLNALYFGDLSENSGEGLNFARSNGNWDTFRAADGTLYFAPNRTTGGNSDGFRVITSAGGTVNGNLRIAKISSGNEGSGIEIVTGIGGNTSPFIRFFDIDNGNPDATTTNDNNWAIGADDTGTSSFKFVCGNPNGAAGSSVVSDIQGASAVLELTHNGWVYGNVVGSYYAMSQSNGGVGGTAVNTIWNGGTVPQGTYLVSCDIKLAPGNSDTDQVVIELRKNGSYVSGGWADIGRNDSGYAGQSSATDGSGYTGLDDAGSFTALVTCSGSDTLTVVTYTTDPGDPGGANYQTTTRVFRLGR